MFQMNELIKNLKHNFQISLKEFHQFNQIFVIIISLHEN